MIQYIGVNDRQIDLFEGQYRVSNGMSYNSYLLTDEKIAVMDTVDIRFSQEWLENIEQALQGRKPDYLVILHMEPDHSASLQRFMEKYPDTAVVGNGKTFPMIRQFFPGMELKNTLTVKEGDTLSLGAYTLRFVFAPMVHWPEVMMAYEEKTKALFSADAFGKFGALDTPEEWKDEARRYYIGIVGKYGSAVQALFKKVAGLELRAIYPLHGPVLKENLDGYLNLYRTWSSYRPEEDGVCIAYASVYGNTKKAAEALAERLAGTKCELFDLARCDMAQAIAKAFAYSKLVIASPTYNGGVFPPVEAFLHGLKERNFQNRTVAVIENGSWLPMARKYILNYLADSKNLEFTEEYVSIKSALNGEALEAIEKLSQRLKQ